MSGSCSVGVCGRLQVVRLQKQLVGLNQAVHLSDMRTSYRANEDVLLESNLASQNPFEMFHVWFQQATSESRSFEEANATCLSTATIDGRPSSRMVLLKGYSQLGFKFFSCYSSRKANELTNNPNAAMLFYWPNFHRQIRIEGQVERLSASEADDYWPTRPLESRLSAYISQQSQPIASRKALEMAKAQARDQLVANGNGTVPRPDHWGGFILKPIYFEFWQGQSDRLHDRIIFRRPSQEFPSLPLNSMTSADAAVENDVPGDGWIIERLQP